MEKELIVKWRIRESETSRVLGLLPALAKKTKEEEGNIFYTVYQSESNPNEIILHECYADEAAVEAHRNSAHYQEVVVQQIVPHLELREVTFIHPFV